MTPMRPTDQATSVSSHGHRRISSKRISVSQIRRRRRHVPLLSLAFMITTLLAGAGRTETIIDLPLSASGLARAKASTELRVTFADSVSVVVGPSRSAKYWTIHDGRLTLALPFKTDSLASVRRIVGRTGNQRTSGAICGLTLAMAAAYLYADSRWQGDSGDEWSGYRGPATASLALVAGIGGAIVGSLVGRHYSKYEVIYE